MSGSYFKRGALIESFSSIATAGGTTTLTASSTTFQIFTGTANQNVVLPNATTCDGGSNNRGGQKFYIINNSTGAITLKDNASTTLKTIKPNTAFAVILTDDTSAAGSWAPLNFSGAGGTGNGTGDDLISSQFRASFDDEFAESPSDTASSVDVSAGKTQAAYSSTLEGYTLSYDAGKFVSAGTTTTNLNISAGSESIAYNVSNADSTNVLAAVGDMETIRIVTTQAHSPSDGITLSVNINKTGAMVATGLRVVIAPDSGGFPDLTGGTLLFSDYPDLSALGTGNFTVTMTGSPLLSMPAGTYYIVMVATSLYTPSAISWRTDTSSPTYGNTFLTWTGAGPWTSLGLGTAPCFDLAISIPGTLSFTAAIGDVAIYGSEVKKITAVASQSSFTTEAFAVAPTLGASVVISQAVHTKDIYNFTADENPLSAAFTDSFSEILVDYEDTSGSTDKIFDIGTAPVIGFSASHNGTSFTDKQIRPTLPMTEVSTTKLNAAGTQLWLRFFSAKTTGSGTINILRYKAYLQKDPVLSQGGVMWSAYCRTDGATTPVNCTVSVLGGKTTLTFTNNNTYPVGVNPGQTFGSLDVYVNGQLFERFVSGTVPVTDGYYTELSGKAIQLDQDYSASSFAVHVVQRVQAVDTSSTNTTYLKYLQEVEERQTGAFIDGTAKIYPTTTVGAPTSGYFYSTIPNRAPMIDLTSDLKAVIGGCRMPIQQIYKVQDEFGPAGEPVFMEGDDVYGQIRLVGRWTVAINPNGRQIVPSNVGDYAEITFYGTGLKLLGLSIASTPDVRASVDGGAEGANIYLPASTVLTSRGYNPNQAMPVVSGLTLGVHTVKLRVAAVPANVAFFGVDIWNESSDVKVNPGTSYLGGKKLTTTAQEVFAYNSVVTGTRGGRVLVYQNSDGTIGKSWQAVDAAAAYRNSADHSNEEVSKIFNWREFGCGRNDDFSLMGPTGANRVFALDDGTTALLGTGVLTPAAQNYEGIGFTSSGTFLMLTFVGTGLDIIMATHNAGGSNTIDVSVDGSATVGSIYDTDTPTKMMHYKIKVASGLPYGTHTIKFTNTVFGVNYIIKDFIAYQPKKPVMPYGAVEIADYNIMANYTANTVAGPLSIGIDTVGTGVLRKYPEREFVLNAGWNLAQDQFSIYGNTSASASNSFQYTFFGTGFDYRFGMRNSAPAVTFTISVDGSTNLSGFTTSSYGSGINTFTPSTGTVVQNVVAASGNGVSVSGLTLGVHTVIITVAGGADYNVAQCLDVVTPIHSYRAFTKRGGATALVGSQSIADSRLLSDKTSTAKKGYSRVLGLNTVSTSLTSPTVMPEMGTTISVEKDLIDVYFNADVYGGANNNNMYFAIFVDGVQATTYTDMRSYTAGAAETVTITTTLKVSPGLHRVDAYWWTNFSTITTDANRELVVKES